MSKGDLSLKQLFKGALREPFRDGNNDIVRVDNGNGKLVIVTRADAVIDKCISRAERGDMYAVKLIVDLIEPKELRIAVAHAITVEHTLNPILQSIVDKLLLTAPIATPVERVKLPDNEIVSGETDLPE